jgi:cohesin complex subunit SA-1/2
VTFCNQLATNENANLHKLVFEADSVQQDLLNDFVQQHVFSTLQEESHDETKIEELHKKRNILAAYCKLIVYNIIPTKAAADIFKHYLRVRTFFGLLLHRVRCQSFPIPNRFLFTVLQ